MAKATGWRGRMIHRRGCLDLPDVTGETGIPCDADIVSGEILDIRSDSGGDAESPTHENDDERENAQRPHGTATHHTAITRPCGLDVEGWWWVRRGTGWVGL